MIKTAGWATGPKADYAKLNRTLTYEISRMPRKLQNARGRGGSQGIRGVSVELQACLDLSHKEEVGRSSIGGSGT